MVNALSPTMTLREFENGYWYLEQLKNFAERIGIPAAKKLRKDELEKAVVTFLRTGKAALPTKRSLRRIHCERFPGSGMVVTRSGWAAT